MRLTRKLFASVCPVAVLAALSAAPAFAQSTGSAEIETVVVTGTKTNVSGLNSFEPVAKQMSSISSDFIETQTPGQTFFQDLNLLPGYNFTNSDAYGTSGGNIRMHGQPGDHISVTLDGMPLNDTGNYAMYTNQMIDPELLTRVSINQGTTDVDSPTAAVTGGAIAARSYRPEKDFSVLGDVSAGSFSYQRYAVLANTGEIGPYGTTAYVEGSFSSYDEFTGGSGKLRKKQVNAGIFQDFGSAGWMQLSAHFNQNRNGFYRGTYFYAGDTVKKSAWSYNYDSTCSYTAPTAGVADNTMTTCSNWQKLKINPSDTGNIRMASLWHLMPELTLTVDASLQYVLANGGGYWSMKEHSGQLIGDTGTYASTASSALTTPYGCISGANGGCDLNGDGDVRDTVMIYAPNTTNTRRWGFNSSLIYNPFEGHTFRLAYSLDYGVHVQTGQYSLMDPVTGPYSPFAGLKDAAHRIETADGLDLRKRDRHSLAILNQVAFDYQGSFLDDTLNASLGFRLPFMERDMDQKCYTQKGSYNVLCTTEPEKSYNATTGLVTFYSTSTVYVRPGEKVVKYNKFLPHLGLTYKPFGDEHQFFVNYTQELAAPRTDYLYTSTGGIYTTSTPQFFTAFENVKPETSTAYTLGYRFTGERFNASLSLWNTQVKNRIVSSWDETQQLYTDRVVGGINFSGVDMDAFYRVMDELWVYGSASYTGARQTEDTPSGATSAPYATRGRMLSEVPKWTMAGRVQYTPWSELRLGVGGKYVSGRFGNDINTIHVPDYFTVNADANYDLDQIGMGGFALRLNADNLFDRHYYGNISTGTASTSVTVSPVAPRTLSLTLTAKY